MNDKIKINGYYLFEGFDLNGKKVFEKEFENTITNNLFSTVINFFDNSSGQPNDVLNVSHIALGLGTTNAVKTDTILEYEQFRKQISTKSRTVNQFTYKLSLIGEEANFNIREVGTFANADNTVNNGLLISRANVNINKTSSIQYLVTFRLIIQ